MIMTDNWPHTCANSERDGRGNPKQAALEIAYYNKDDVPPSQAA